MANGYQIVEPEALSDLYANKVPNEFIIYILSFVSLHLNSSLKKLGISGTVDVIKVVYTSDYPALGVRGAEENLEKFIEDKCNEFLGKYSLKDIIEFTKEQNEYVLSFIEQYNSTK